MEENLTIKEYMKINGYKVAPVDFDINNLDLECVFIGDVYIVKYKPKYDYFASFQEQTTLKLKMKYAILLRVGFDKYINLSNIKTEKQLDKTKKKLLKNTTIERDKGIILGTLFKPSVGDQVAREVRPYKNIIQNEQENQKVKKINKRLFR